jgi:hypothetical protein
VRSVRSRHSPGPLAARRLIIGPRAEEEKVFSSTTLYYAQLEAMVGRRYAGDETSLTDLVRNHRMLVHPPDIRSSSLLETRIVEWEIDDPGAGQAGAPFRGRRPPLIPRPRR